MLDLLLAEVLGPSLVRARGLLAGAFGDRAGDLARGALSEAEGQLVRVVRCGAPAEVPGQCLEGSARRDGRGVGAVQHLQLLAPCLGEFENHDAPERGVDARPVVDGLLRAWLLCVHVHADRGLPFLLEPETAC